MDRNKRDLEATVASQREQLLRYEKRLKDVVTAYKGLLKEKEALEASLVAITRNSLEEKVDDVAGGVTKSTDTTPPIEASKDDSSRLQTQIITLMNSLATLSAEKSRMEASFQADKKQLRTQLTQKDQQIADLQMQLKENEDRARKSINEVKAKWMLERQEREQETNNQMLTIRELQKLYADERHLKENIEMQLNNFKMQFVGEEAENTRMRELQYELKDAREKLKRLQDTTKKDHNYSEDTEANTALLKQVQQEMQKLKDQHAVAIINEQKRVHLAEQRSKSLASAHEERVASLETRLAELSTTVGTYDRLRQQDQQSIHELKQKLQEIDELKVEKDEARSFNKSDPLVNDEDISNIVNEITRLKRLLINENDPMKHSIDINKFFSIGADHGNCQEDLNHFKQKLQVANSEIQLQREKIQLQNTHISTLQEKLKILTGTIDEQELKLKQQSERHLQAERTKWKKALAETENECRNRVYEIEQQLQTQRQRSLQLLEEKEQEIKTLMTSFEIFQNASNKPTAPDIVSGISPDKAYAVSSDGESIEGGVEVAEDYKLHLKPKKMILAESCHMLHYANEIARKDNEIAALRKAKYAAETSLHKAIHENISVHQELSEKIAQLDDQIDRLERCKTREGANLEYLKNVIISFILTKDADGKQHMLNAICAVLQLTPTEIQAISSAFPKKS